MQHVGPVDVAATDVEQCLGRSRAEGTLSSPPPGVPPGRPRTPLGRAALLSVRIACAAFWLLLTLLLLSPDPRGWLGIERWADRLPDSEAAHVACFALLSFFAYASRLPVSRIALLAALAAYAVAAEALQSLVPHRAAGWGDVTLNFAGLAFGAGLWSAGASVVLALGRRIGVERPATVEIDTMYNLPRFRIVTVEGLLSHDTFVISAEQPASVKAGCLVVVNESDGGLVTVHRDRLVPVEPALAPVIYHQSRTACLKCGRVEGVVGDRVTCPHHGDVECGLLEARRTRAHLTAPMAAR